MSFFKDKTIVMSGGSRGVGLEIAKALGKDGANIAILAKTTEHIQNFQEPYTQQLKILKKLGAMHFH